MIFLAILIITFAAGLLGWIAAAKNKNLCKLVCLAALFIDFILAVYFWLTNYNQFSQTNQQWLSSLKYNWIPQIGVSFFIAIDGLNLLLILLTILLGFLAIAASWNQIHERLGFFHFNLMLILTAVIGVFVSMDLFLFYFFWELMLVPMYFFISIWGYENRSYAAIKFFIFTQAASLFMLLSILGVYFIHAKNTGVYTFDFTQWQNSQVTGKIAAWLMLGFFVGFAVKIPVVPIHTWLADAHTQAPTAGSVILAGLLLKTGAYGLLRFVLPLFSNIIWNFSTIGMILGIIGILYGAVLAFAQTDLKRLVAYTSISHMGFVLFGISSGNSLALKGAVIVMLAHGFSTGGLFILVGVLQERLHTRDLNKMGGLWSVLPKTGGVGLFLALASLGLPGLANFIGEFLVLIGAYSVNPLFTVIASLGLITAAIYSLWFIFRTFQGPLQQPVKISDLQAREMAVFSLLIILILWVGIYPQPFINTFNKSIDKINTKIVNLEK